MMDHTVVTIFKHNKDIAVRPADINMIHTYSQSNLNNRKITETEFWREMCLPGMTEDFRLPVFFSYFPDKDQISKLKLVFVCEDKNEKVTEKLSIIAYKIFDDVRQEKLVNFLEHSELIMFNDV